MFVNIITECEGRAAYDILRGTGFELCTGYGFHTLINVVMQRSAKTSKLKDCMTANVGREKIKSNFKILY